jgi:hypothetical protein
MGGFMAFRWLLGLGLFLSLQAQATVVRQDSRYVYHITPWTQMKDVSDDQMQFVIKTSLQVTMSYVQDMVAQRFFPTEFVSIDDFRQLEMANRQVDTLLDDINRWVIAAKQRKKMPTKWSLVPDAFMFYVGGRLSGNYVLGGGISVTLGAVVMPVYVVQVDKRTGERKEGMKFPVELVVLGTPQFGAGVGTSAGLRGGLGLIWGGVHFADPSQFVGMGGGASGSAALPLLPFFGQLGGNVQAGTLFNDMPGNPDFYYALVGVDGGPIPSPNFEAHATVNMVMSLQEFFHLFYKASDRALQQEKRKIEDELSRLYTDYYNNSKPGEAADPGFIRPYRPFGGTKKEGEKTEEKAPESEEKSE